MAIKVELEPANLREKIGRLASLQEDCIFCHQPTRYWWNKGEAPCCQDCAKKESVESLKLRLIRNQLN